MKFCSIEISPAMWRSRLEGDTLRLTSSSFSFFQLLGKRKVNGKGNFPQFCWMICAPQQQERSVAAIDVRINSQNIFQWLLEGYLFFLRFALSFNFKRNDFVLDAWKWSFMPVNTFNYFIILYLLSF